MAAQKAARDAEIAAKKAEKERKEPEMAEIGRLIATTLRERGGKVETTDGPFAETREHLGGFYLIEAATLDDALAFAAVIPVARLGSIEVRPVMDYS